MAKRDVNQEALRQVEHVTNSKPVDGESLLESEELKHQLREAKKRLSDEADSPRVGREGRKS